MQQTTIYNQSQSNAVQTPSTIEIVKVKSGNQLKRFIDFPHELYKDDSNYVPELFLAQRDMLKKGKHPSHQHIEFELYLAFQSQKVVGRIGAFYNKNHIDYVQKQEAAFGFFDCIDQYEVAAKLLQTAIDYLKQKEVKDIIGPINLSTNNASGLLIDGFKKPPQMMMTYNKPYYQNHIEQFGFEKRMDLLAYWLGVDATPKKLPALAARIEERLRKKGIIIRAINLKDFNNEVQKVLKIYNDAWEKNWGFVPMTTEEFMHAAKDMKQIMDKELVYLAEKDGEPIGFVLALPNINEVLIDVKKGRLLPTGIFKLLFQRSKIKSVRVITLGITEAYRKLGIEACFYNRIQQITKKRGYIGGEASWILEDNTMMNRGLQQINAEIYKTYRLYQKSIQ